MQLTLFLVLLTCLLQAVVCKPILPSTDEKKPIEKHRHAETRRITVEGCGGEDEEEHARHSTHSTHAVVDQDTGHEVEQADSDDSFPTPSQAIPALVEKAKDFARRYLAPEQIDQLQTIVSYERKNGSTQEQVRKAVQKYLSSVLDPVHKKEILSRQQQLQKDFGENTLITDIVNP
ncbi:Protein F10D7.1 [Aphelenchoides avenae]|nr:Protein F10D7.1 [Aphelenchus avenae]